MRITQDRVVHEVGTSADESSSDEDGIDMLAGEYAATETPPTVLSRSTIRLVSYLN